MDTDSKLNDSKTESDAVTTQTKASGLAVISSKKKPSDHVSKYSSSRKSSVDTTNTNQKSMIRLENTFRLGPDENKRFHAYKLQASILELIADKMNNSERANPNGYNAKACATLTRELADNIRREAKNLSVPRYKIVVHVVVGENNDGKDSVRVASRCLWNTDHDNCVSLNYKSKFMWASACIYVLYTE